MVVDVTKLGTLLTKPCAKEKLIYYTPEEWQQIVDHYSDRESNADGKECGSCFFDEMHEYHDEYEARVKKVGLKKVSEQKMKETLKNINDQQQKQQTVEWLNTSIQKLEEFKTQVEAGKIVMTDGYMDDNYPVPQLAERSENNLSLSIDFIEKQTPPGQNF